MSYENLEFVLISRVIAVSDKSLNDRCTYVELNGVMPSRLTVKILVILRLTLFSVVSKPFFNC